MSGIINLLRYLVVENIVFLQDLHNTHYITNILHHGPTLTFPQVPAKSAPGITCCIAKSDPSTEYHVISFVHRHEKKREEGKFLCILFFFSFMCTNIIYIGKGG